LNKDDTRKDSQSITYRDAGVDIEAGDALVERIKPFAKKNYATRSFRRHWRLRIFI